MTRELPEHFYKRHPWGKSKDSIWPATAFTLRRNIGLYPFPSKASSTEALNIIGHVEKALFPELKNPKLFTNNTLPPVDKEFLFEHFILTEDYQVFSEGRGLVIDEQEEFLGLINVEDHLHFHLFSIEKSLSKPLKFLMDLDDKLSKQLQFAFSSKLGFLTSDPLLCGTGLSVEAFLHVPMLIQSKKFPEVLDELSNDVVIRGLGEQNTYLGNLVLIENRKTLGITEDLMIHSIKTAANYLAEKEREARKNVSLEMQDKIGRAYGLLTNASLLETGEALSSLSLLSLGKDLGYLENANAFNFFDLFFDVRRAHLMQQDSSSKELPEKRGDLIKEALKQVNISNN